MTIGDDEGNGLGAQTRPDRSTLLTVAGCLLIAAASWYLLKEFALLLRPLFLAVFLCYMIVPAHLYLRQRIPMVFSMIILVGLPVAVLNGLAWLVHSSVVELDADLPRLGARVEALAQGAQGFVQENFPWLIDPVSDAKAEEQRNRRLRELTQGFVNVAADTLIEASVVGIYLLFLLLEAAHSPARVRRAFDSAQAEQILTVVGNINRTISAYVRLKVVASLYLAVPVTIVLWACGVKFALLWGVLTFMCNFIPYLGSIVAVSTPIAFAFLWLDPGWRPIATAAGIIAIHLIMTYLVEPNMVGKGVGLSPLVILIALTFWGQCWGFIGMFLAIPLTVMLKIVLQNVAFTRPLANMLGES